VTWIKHCAVVLLSGNALLDVTPVELDVIEVSVETTASEPPVAAWLLCGQTAIPTSSATAIASTFVREMVAMSVYLLLCPAESTPASEPGMTWTAWYVSPLSLRSSFIHSCFGAFIPAPNAYYECTRIAREAMSCSAAAENTSMTTGVRRRPNPQSRVSQV